MLPPYSRAVVSLLPCTEARKLLDSIIPPPCLNPDGGVGENIVHYLLVLAKCWIQIPPPPLFESRFTHTYTIVIAPSALGIKQAHAMRLKRHEVVLEQQDL